MSARDAKAEPSDGRAARGGGGWLEALAVGLFLGAGLALADDRRDALRRQRAAIPLPSAARSVAAPTGIEGRAWRAIFARTLREFGEDRIPTASAAVTFYMLLALFPALSAFVSLYGLVANVDDARRALDAMRELLPGGAISVISDQLTRLAQTGHGALGAAFLVSLAVSIWSATSGAKALIEALNVAYEARERRGLIVINLLALAATVGAIVLAAAGLALVAAAPATLARLGVGGFVGEGLLQWPALLALAILLFAVFYRIGPSRRRVALRWIAPGAILAAVAWIAMSGLFSWYVANFGHYDKTYGSLGAVVGFLTWIWLSLMIVLFGAELNSEIEHQARIAA